MPFSGIQARLDAQLGHPAGSLGRVLLEILNRANRKLNHATVDALDLRSGERVLDVGFGGGVGVRAALKTGADVIAIDPSPTAVATGRKHLGGRAAVRQGDVIDIGERAGSLDAAYAVNTVYFWSDLAAGLGSLLTVLRPGGRLALGVELSSLARHAAGRSDLPPTPTALVNAMTAAGFHAVHVASANPRWAVVAASRGT